MTIYVGQGVYLFFTCRDPVTGDVTTPAAMTVTVTPDKGSTSTFTLDQLTVLSTGVYRVLYVPVVDGSHVVRAVASNPALARKFDFNVAA